MKKVTIYSDGACSGNPGPGGYAALLVYGAHERKISGGFRRTTNNRMELMAVIKALEALKEKCDVTIVSDSEYVVKGIREGWAARWRSKGWRRPGGGIVPNWELWDRLLDLTARHEVTWKWVQGHAGHVENEQCDEAAVAAASAPNLPPDAGYENPPRPPGA